MYFYNQVNKYRHLLNENEQNYIYYFLEKKNNIENLTIKQICRELFVTPNTIIRFCKKLGFSGYSSFKEALLHSYLHQQIADRKAIPIDHQLKRTSNLLQLEIVEKITKHIHTSNKIVLLAVGLSRQSANEFNEKLQMIGLNSKTFIDPHFTLYNCSLLTKSDILIAFSTSGETKSIIEAVNIALLKGTTTVSITGLSSNLLASLTNYQLYADIRPQAFKGIDITNRLPFSYLANIMFNSYLDKYYPGNNPLS